MAEDYNYAQYETVATVTAGVDETVIENTSREAVYVSTQAGTTFNYGGSEYESNGEYLMIEPEQSVSVSNTETAAYADSALSVSLRPLDIAEKKFYASYGEYPQTYVGDTLNETLKGLADSAKTGKQYTTDIDGIETILEEYLYEGEKYVKLSLVNTYENNYTFKDGITIVETTGTVYFFLVEPILCKAMEINGSKATMITVEILGSMAFDHENEVYDNSWKNSDIREYLNNIFLNESGLRSIVQSSIIENKDEWQTSTTEDNTKDKLFLASAEEICRWSGASYDQFIANYWLDDENNSKRQIKPTDMAIATYCYYYKTNNTGSYWLRSPGDNGSGVCFVGIAGNVNTNYNYFNTCFGFCPCFVVEI